MKRGWFEAKIAVNFMAIDLCLIVYGAGGYALLYHLNIMIETEVNLMRLCKKIIKTGLLLACLNPLVMLSAADELVFSTAPTQPPAETLKMYQPIVDHLARVTGEKIVLKPAKNFLEYTAGIQQKKYDILFDGPQFVGWRMQQYGHKVIARLPGQIVFVVVARKDSGITDYKKLVGRKVCAFASPNLLTLGFLNQYPSPASQPIMVRVKSFKESLDCVKKGDGIASVMRDKFWEKRTPEQKHGLQLIYTTKSPYPHRAFSVSKRVNRKTRLAILNALLDDAVSVPGAAVFNKFRSKKFMPASAREYKGMGALLSPVWGFRD